MYQKVPQAILTRHCHNCPPLRGAVDRDTSGDTPPLLGVYDSLLVACPHGRGPLLDETGTSGEAWRLSQLN
jgi:hypothetical protein